MNPKILVCFAIISSGALLGCSNVARGDEVSGPKPAQPSPALEFDSLQMIDRETMESSEHSSGRLTVIRRIFAR